MMRRRLLTWAAFEFALLLALSGCVAATPTTPTSPASSTSIVAVQVVLLDYWSAWLGGKYAEAQGPAYVHAPATITDQLNAVIKQTATDSGSAYVDLRAAFKGPDYTYDETHYLASDGDHPNAAGHRQIATAVVDVLNHTPHG